MTFRTFRKKIWPLDWVTIMILTGVVLLIGYDVYAACVHPHAHDWQLFYVWPPAYVLLAIMVEVIVRHQRPARSGQ